MFYIIIQGRYYYSYAIVEENEGERNLVNLHMVTQFRLLDKESHFGLAFSKAQALFLALNDSPS